MQPFDRHENFFSSVVLTPAVPTYDLIFRLEPDSNISGVVLDEAGEAVRNARVALYASESLDAEAAEGRGSMRSSTTTDDRGHYEFAGLAPGEYNVSVNAQPWYAAASQGRRFAIPGGPPPDPTLDVVYAQTWFPGVTERRSAEVLSLHHGDAREADFNLIPTPASHLLITPPQQGAPGAQRGQIFPQVERVSSEGGMPSVNTSLQVDPQGHIDVGGLSPGLYRVTMQGSSGPQTPAFVRVPGGDQHSIELSSAIPVADLTLQLEPAADTDRLRVTLTDIESGASFVSYGLGNLQRRPNSERPNAPGGDRRLEVPPGRYRVTLGGDNDIYLSGISAKNSAVSGRIVTVGSGSTTLALEMTRGRASAHGTVSFGGKPLSGAMVMLVPATFGQAGSITFLARDQTNTDGGFLIERVIPGDYILLAIQNGWAVNWKDPLTLERYLIHGVPLSLGPGVNAKQDLVAQSP